MLHISKLECVQKRLVSLRNDVTEVGPSTANWENFARVSFFCQTSPIRTKDKDSKIVFHGKGKKFALQFWIF